jgi:transmembrane 9 superfamily protein 2/4
MSRLRCLLAWGVLALSLPLSAHAFYLPGTAPHDYLEGDPVDVYVNALTPMLSGNDEAKLVCLFSQSH